MKYIHNYVQKLKNEAFIEGNELRGCTDAEISTLVEQATKLGLFLPQAYIELLYFAGHKMGGITQNCRFDYELSLKTLDLIRKNKLQPYQFVFLYTLKYKAVFNATEQNDNPVIYEIEYDETYPTYRVFSDFICDKANNYIDSRNTIPKEVQMILASLRRTIIDILSNHSKSIDKEDAFCRSLERTKSSIIELNNYNSSRHKTVPTDYSEYIDSLIARSDKYCLYDNNYRQKLTEIKQAFIDYQNVNN